MFKTIFTVRKRTGWDYGSDIFSAYFENFDDAKKFAEAEAEKVNKTDKVFSFSKKTHLDGSFTYSWLSENCWITLDDFAYITDYRFNGHGFYDNTGLLVGDFKTLDDLRGYFRRSVEMALN